MSERNCLLVSQGWKTFDLPDFSLGGSVSRVIQIPHQLQIEPKLRFHPEKSFKPQRRVRCNPSLTVNQLIDTGVGHTDLLGQFLLRYAQRFEKLLEQHLAGMCGWSMSRNSCHLLYLPSILMRSL